MLHHLLSDHSVVAHQALDGATEHFQSDEEGAYQQYGDRELGVKLKNDVRHIDMFELVGGLEEEGGLVVFDCSYRIPYGLHGGFGSK